MMKMQLLLVLLIAAAVCLTRCRAEDEGCRPGDDEENVETSASTGAGQAAVGGVLPLWTWGKASASKKTKKMRIVGLKLYVYELERTKKHRIRHFGHALFDCWRAADNGWTFPFTGAGSMHTDCLGKVSALERSLYQEQHTKDSKDYNIQLIKNDINEKKNEFGQDLFQCLHTLRGLANFVFLRELFFEAMFRKTLQEVENIETMLLEKRDEIKVLSS